MYNDVTQHLQMFVTKLSAVGRPNHANFIMFRNIFFAMQAKSWQKFQSHKESPSKKLLRICEFGYGGGSVWSVL